MGQMAEMTADVICRTIFGAELGHAAATTVVRAFSEYQALIGQMDLMSLLGLPDFVPRLHGRRIAHCAGRIHAVIGRLMDEILHGKRRGEASLIRSLADTEAGGRGLSVEAVRNKASVLFMAGQRPPPTPSPGPGSCCRRTPRPSSGCTPKWTSSTASRRPMPTCRASASPVP